MKIKVGDCFKTEFGRIIRIYQIVENSDGPWYCFTSAIDYKNYSHQGSIKKEHFKRNGFKYCKVSTVLYGS